MGQITLSLERDTNFASVCESVKPYVLIICLGFEFCSLVLCAKYTRILPKNALIRSKLEYTSFVRNNFVFADPSKIEIIQRKYVSLCYYVMAPFGLISYANVI